MGTGPARASGVSDNVVVDGAEMGVRDDELGLAAGLSDVLLMRWVKDIAGVDARGSIPTGYQMGIYIQVY